MTRREGGPACGRGWAVLPYCENRASTMGTTALLALASVTIGASGCSNRPVAEQRTAGPPAEEISARARADSIAAVARARPWVTPE